jgi:hypothetical protein
LAGGDLVWFSVEPQGENSDLGLPLVYQVSVDDQLAGRSSSETRTHVVSGEIEISTFDGLLVARSVFVIA